jgi:o-succinylbenzoate synthase
MYYNTRISPYTLNFTKPAGTSRGVYLTRKVWFVIISTDDYPEISGIGECAPLPDLSCDFVPEYENILREACIYLEQNGKIDEERLRSYPSILFGLETALRHYEQGSFSLWDTPFSKGLRGIPINGLIWMDNIRNMSDQVEEKIKSGFKCIKLKIGTLNFEEELDMIEAIRKKHNTDEITLRVDANGAFSTEDAPAKLRQLSKFGIHSIEQPILAGQWKKMSEIVAGSPLPVALDEELIGLNNINEKQDMLNVIKPDYIILKPSLHGGISGCKEWIALADKMRIGWWITSALESNIGLNAIAQWCATLNNPKHHGLGTGLLYTNNINMPLCVIGEHLWYNPA